MTEAANLPSTLWVQLRPTWTGSGFVEERANLLWSLLPKGLQEIAIAELAAGNVPESIQIDRTSWVVLLNFSEPPRTQEPRSHDIRVHREYAFGNYCYDGTLCTYELLDPRSFITFTDPTYNYDQEFEDSEP